MDKIDLEILIPTNDFSLFLEKTAQSINAGYGAGNCTPDSVAFWSSYPKEWSDAIYTLISVRLDHPATPGEMASCVRKVDPSKATGEIISFGRVVGRWTVRRRDKA